MSNTGRKKSVNGSRQESEEGNAMARVTAMDALESKVEKAQQLVSRTKKQYDAATARLSDLLDKLDALKRDELVKAIMNSDRTYEEVMDFLSNTEEKTAEDERGTKPDGKRGRKAKRADR